MDSLLQLQALLGLVAMAFTCFWWLNRVPSKGKKRREAPQPPGALPLIGHLHLLWNKEPLQRTLAALADRYGPVFVLRLGCRRTIVVSSCAAAAECFSVNDRALASRPTCAAGEYLGYDYAMFGFAPYGPYWRAVRKLATVGLLSSFRVAMLERVRSAEVSAFVREVYDLWEAKGKTPVLVDMKQWFRDLSFSIIVRAVAGKRCSGGGGGEVRQLKQGVSEFFRLLGAFAASDYLPFLRWVDLRGHEKAMKAAARDMDAVVATWLEEHRRRRASAGKPDGDRDFMEMMLSAIGDPEFAEFDPDTVMKVTSLAMILGGTETTAISLTKNLAILLNNPEVLRKAQAEVDLHVGRHRNVEESDVPNLVYLQAVVKETLRLHPTAPLTQPHEAVEECEVAGFHVPAGTRVLANIWKLQRDPAAWPDDPAEFKPERFLEHGSHAYVEVKGHHFELIPFGAGRRICPGASFALHVVHLTLARLIHGFELEAPPSAGGTLDMGESLYDPGPLEVALAPRLPPEIYRRE